MQARPFTQITSSSFTASIFKPIIMAIFQQHSSSFVITLVPLLIAVHFVDPISSTSRGAFEHQTVNANHQVGFGVTLRHVDSGKNLTRLECVQRGINRGKQRWLQRLTAMMFAASTADNNSQLVETPVHAGADGAYLMELSIGTPPVSHPGIMDTGADLIWTQCKPCSKCFKQPTPIFDPNKSTTFSKLSCSSDLCGSIPSTTCSNGCQYVYTYGDRAITKGILATETFTFGDSDNQVSVHNIGFGCGGYNEGQGLEQASGLVGLARGPLSLVSQLKEPKFSYCLTSFDDDSKQGTLFLGSLAIVNSTQNAKTTPLLTNPLHPSSYYLSLEGISVGETRLPIENSTFEIKNDGSGGLVVDSGTTITYIEESAFEELKKEFVSQINLPLSNSGSNSTGFEVCFTLPCGEAQVKIPKLVFHFKDADLELPSDNYMIPDSNLGVTCLAMEAFKGLSVFGNVQQQNILVYHDLEKETISFVPTQCNLL